MRNNDFILFFNFIFCDFVMNSTKSATTIFAKIVGTNAYKTLPNAFFRPLSPI